LKYIQVLLMMYHGVMDEMELIYRSVPSHP
jgi:hypothetical protein